VTKRRSLSGREWAYAGAVLGAVTSIAGNVASAALVDRPGAPDRSVLVGMIAAVFWPVALLVSLEVLTRIAWPDGKAWTVIRYGGLAPVAAVTAVVSYLHMSTLLNHFKEGPVTAYAGPLAVDGMMVLCSVALLAEAKRSRSTGRRPVNDRVPAVAEPTAPVATDRLHLVGTAGDGPVDVEAVRLEWEAADRSWSGRELADRLGRTVEAARSQRRRWEGKAS
jgi:hypothetical protein